MAFVNNVQIIRRDLLIRIAELFHNDKLQEEIDRIPIEIAKRIRNNQRCCYHKTKAVVKYKIMGCLGFGLEDEKDELDTLGHYAGMALQCEGAQKKHLVVAHEACTSCVKSSYVITNLCKGCIAQPCISNCPKNAVTWSKPGPPVIDSDECINCGICKSLCPYHAIVYLPVPCEESCPVGAIKKDIDGREQIDESKCILCGKCVNACPFGSIMEVTGLIQIMLLLKKSKNTVAIVAPSVFGQFQASKGAIIEAIQKAGFGKVVEVAEGARMTTIHESRELEQRMDEGESFITTSCCKAWVEAAHKHIPQILPFVSNTPTPMHFTAKKCKEENPDSQVVFIGPCLAKRKEGIENEYVDYVMTFEELSCLLVALKISVGECGEAPLNEQIDDFSRNYCVSGGVAAAVQNESTRPINIKTINGLDKKQIRLLSVFAKTKKAGGANLVEVMACEGGCIAGPCSNEFPKEARRYLRQNVPENEGVQEETKVG